MKNYGLIVEDIIIGEDYLGGTIDSLEAKYGADAINPEADWTRYTPSTEDQSTDTGDTFACVSFGTTNAVEMLARARWGNVKNLSDRMLAKTSGTIVGQGNSPKKVADTLRHTWTVNETEWPDVPTVQEFYSDIPDNLRTLAVARGAEFEFGYQYIANSKETIKAALKHSPVCIAVTAWVEKDGVYVRGPFTENHWTTIIKVLENGNYLCFDSFYPFIKEVHPSAAQSVAMSYYLNRQVVSEKPWKKFLKAIFAFFSENKPESIAEAEVIKVALQTSSYTPTPPPPEPVKPKYDWSNPTAVRHSVRVMCDEAGLSLAAKNIITACIKQESQFNTKAIGKPNSNGTQDFGLCQYNNGKNKQGVPYWIGPGAAFKDVDEVLNDPEKNVRIMIQMYQAGKIGLWASYSTGAYKRWL